MQPWRARVSSLSTWRPQGSGLTSDNIPLPLPIAGSERSMTRALPVAEYVAASTSQNTRRAYRLDLLDFEAWGGALPTSPELLATYIAERASTLSPYTIARRLVGIGRAHTSQGLENPAKSDLVATVMRGIRRTHGKPQRRVAPLLRQDIFNILPLMVGTRGVRDRALLLVGFAAALRRSELTSLHVEDFAFCEEGMLIHLRRSKTDQVGEGRQIAVPFGRTGVCAVGAMRTWLLHSNVESGPAFRSVDKAGRVRGGLSSQSVAIILKTYAGRIGISPGQISGHSLRAGFVTSAAQAGAAIHKIQQQTGHRSLAMLARYIRDGRIFQDNACALIL